MSAPLPELPSVVRPHRVISPVIRGAVIERFNRTCQYCLRSSESYFKGPNGLAWHVDHIVPRSAGGSNDIENLTLACSTCNAQKRTGEAHFGAGPQPVKRTSVPWRPRIVEARRRDGDATRSLIVAFLESHPETPPTQRQIAAGIGKGLSTTNYHIQRLSEEGILISSGQDRTRVYRLANLGGAV